MSKLRSLMVEAKEIETISAYFDQHLGTDSVFLDAGRPKENARLAFIGRLAMRTVVPGQEATEVMLMQVTKHHLWHGALIYPSGAVGRVIYFDDVNRGLCTAVQGPSAVSHHFRFSIPEELPQDVDINDAEVRAIPLARRQSGGIN